MSEREDDDSPHHHHHHLHPPPESQSQSLWFIFKILLHSFQILSSHKRIFLSIFLLLAFPLSLLLFTLSLSSHPLKSHILHLESVLRHSPTRFEFRHVFSESRHDAFSLLRLRAVFSLPISAFSLLAAVSTVSSTLLSFHSNRPSLKSSLSALRNTWTRPLLTTLCIYALLVAYSIVPNTLASIARSPALRFAVLILGVAFEVYLIAILGLGLVVSIAEDRFGFDAIRAAAALMADRRLSGSVLTAMFLLASSWISSEMEGLMDGVDHWMRSTAAVTSNVAIGVGDKIGLISLYGMVILAGWGWSRDQESSKSTHSTRGQAFRVLANPNVSPGRNGLVKQVIMVDPLEAKRMAAKEMEKIKAKEKLKRRRQIEAINGAWAMIGLTAGLVIEAQTGKGILAQLADYFAAVVNFFVQ